MSNVPITIVDYGVGNLLSIQNAIARFKGISIITSSLNELEKAQKVILPGVGSFPAAMKKLRELDLVSGIQQYANSGRPLLGICLGMQLLFEVGHECGETEGLGLIEGHVESLLSITSQNSNCFVPNIGWRTLKIKCQADQKQKSILDNVTEEDYFYFLHSFACKPSKSENSLAYTSFGNDEFVSVTKNMNVTGVQFHPERSGRAGLNLLRNFMTS
jgi:glutamine amidotransferase